MDQGFIFFFRMIGNFNLTRCEAARKFADHEQH